MAVPNMRLYFLASQLQHLGGCGGVDIIDPICNILFHVTSSLPAASHLEADLPQYPKSMPIINLLSKLWGLIKHSLGMRGFTMHTPLWCNPRYTELQKLEEFQSWEAKGIRYISQLYSQTILKYFTALQEKFGLPRHNFIDTSNSGMLCNHRHNCPGWNT